MAVDREGFEKLQNDVEMIKTRVSSLDRIAVLQNRGLIIDDLKALVGRSGLMAAVLHITTEEVYSSDLADALGIDHRNLNKLVVPLMGNKGYLNQFRHGGRVSYRRDEKIDLIGFEDIEPFRALIEQWKATRQNEQ